MKNIKRFREFYIKENSDELERFTKKFKSMKDLPASSGEKNPEQDEDIFWFSTKDEKKSLILDIIFEVISSIPELKNAGEITADDFRCYYKPGDKEIVYTYEFHTPDDDIVKKTANKYEGHEWQFILRVPSYIIQKLNSTEITDEVLKDAKNKIKSESKQVLRDGMHKSDGWQQAYIDGTEEVDQWIEQQKKSDSWKPQWLKDFATWFTDKFA